MTVPLTFLADTKDISNLLSRAGFTLLTVDIDEVHVAYPSMWELLEDLRDMGEANAVVGRCVVSMHECISESYWNYRRHFLPRDTLAAASAIYKGLITAPEWDMHEF